MIIHPHQRCGYSDSPFARIHYFYTAGSSNELEGHGNGGSVKLSQRKRHLFVIEKYVEDLKQDEKSVPDLLESIMRPTDPVKEELRRISCKMNKIIPKVTKIRVSTFWMSGKSTDSRRRPTQPARLLNRF